MLSLIVVMILSYLTGSIPTAIIVSRIVIKDDIRNHGSRNAGATNVFRVMGLKFALFVTLVDMGKGALAVLVISRLASPTVTFDPILVQIFAGCFAVIGHVWTVFAGFRGGKGVATAFGVLVSLAPIPSLITLAIWIFLVLTTRYVSVGSIFGGLAFPILLVIQKQFFNPDLPIHLLALGIVLFVLIVVTHRTNIGRLLGGQENRFGKMKERD